MGGVGLVVEHLHLPHGAVLVPDGLLVLDPALKPVLAQSPGEGGSGSGAISNAGNLKLKSLVGLLILSKISSRLVRTSIDFH